MKETLRLLDAYCAKHYSSKSTLSINIFIDGSGNISDFVGNAVFKFDSVEELEKELKK